MSFARAVYNVVLLLVHEIMLDIHSYSLPQYQIWNLLNHGDPTICASHYTCYTLPTHFSLSLHILHSPYIFYTLPTHSTLSKHIYTLPTYFTLSLHIVHFPSTFYTIQAHLHCPYTFTLSLNNVHCPYTLYTLPTYFTLSLHILHSVSIFCNTLSTYLTLSKHITSGHTAPPIAYPSANVSNGCMSRPTPTTEGGEHLTR